MASTRFTMVGKYTTIPVMTVTPSGPRPKTRVMIGVMATRGTERSTMARGRKACSTPRRSTKTTEMSTAETVPTR